ncbi:hypothetical protein HMPREF0969_00246 [Bacteroides sp. D20]|nr:hypothetical protein HMPREF0969_00246 [Bacteroides sp. D20]
MGMTAKRGCQTMPCTYAASLPRAFCRGVCRPEEQTDLTNSRKPHQNSRF